MEFKAVKPWCDFSLKVCEREQIQMAEEIVP